MSNKERIDAENTYPGEVKQYNQLGEISLLGDCEFFIAILKLFLDY